MSKYGSIKTVSADGITFDSKKEALRYGQLKLLQRAGQISGLELQKVYRLEVNDTLICRYIADFAYKEGGKEIVEDVKSAFTRKLPVYSIKRKLMDAIYGIEIRET